MWKCWLSKYGILKNQYIGDYFGGIVNKKRGELPHYKAISNLFSPFPSQDINSKFSAFFGTLKSQGQETVKKNRQGLFKCRFHCPHILNLQSCHQKFDRSFHCIGKEKKTVFWKNGLFSFYKMRLFCKPNLSGEPLSRKQGKVYSKICFKTSL